MRHVWAQVIGFVDLDELSGIRAKGFADHTAFCHQDGHEDRLCFWDGQVIDKDWVKAAERVTALEALFFARYPEQGHDQPPPKCDWHG